MDQVVAAVRFGWGARQDILHGWIAAERGRIALWLPVFMGAGVVFYFCLRAEPVWWAGGAVALPAAAASWLARPWLRVLLMPLAATSIGFASAQFATARALPLETLPRKAVTITGTIRGVELLPVGRRVTFEAARLDDDPPLARRLRVRLRDTDQAAMQTGDRVRVRALVRAPAPPAYPGGWDLQRDSFFAGTAGSGFALGYAERVEESPPHGLGRWIQGLRDAIEARVIAAVPGAAGAVSATLLTGLTSGIPQSDRAAFRDFGLAHLLAVAGLHVGIVMGCVMTFTRHGLALWERAALRWPCRQIAALAALAAGGAYMVITGMHVPIVRSFAMACLFTLAVVAGRRAVSLRGLALAAVVLMLVAPQEVVGVSFQMSFSAVLALIAGYEALRPHLRTLRGSGSWHRRFLLHVTALALTSALAGTASAPFGAYHFGRLQLYFVLSNMVAVPLTAMWVMPAGLIGLMLMPLGLEKLALVPMGFGAEAILWIARATAALPAATLEVPHAPAWGLCVLAVGMAWLGLWRTRIRLAGLALIVAGLVSPFLVRPPDILVSDDARLIGFRTPSGIFMQSMQGASKFTRESWEQFWADARVTTFPRDGVAADGMVDCTPRDCLLVTKPDQQAALLVRPGYDPARCDDVDLVLAAEPAKAACRRYRPQLVDRFTVWREGSQAIWLEPAGPIVSSDRQERGDRPWVPPLPRPRARTNPVVSNREPSRPEPEPSPEIPSEEGQPNPPVAGGGPD